MSPRERSKPSADVLDAAVRLARIRQRMFARVEPTRIAQYHIMRRIGDGGMGLVFAAWDPSLDRAVAIKVLRDTREGGGEELRAEAQALARLGHANVVSVFEVGEHEGQLYLAMEYVEGQTLREWAGTWRRSKRRDWVALREVFIQAARGLAAAHAAGVVHRDVKPENMMIDADGRVRVMDFGLARNHRTGRAETTRPRDKVSSGEGTSTVSAVCGTPAYMAPEQFDGQRAAATADQFSFGASLFEVVYGTRIRPSKFTAAAATADEPIELPAKGDVPRPLQRLLARMLALDPAARFGSMEHVAAELSRQNERKATRWVMFGTAVAATGLAAGLAFGTAEDTRCTGAAEQLDGVWDASTAAAVQQTFAAEPTGLGASTWTWVSPMLDAFRERWIAEYQSTCEATHVRQELPPAEMERRVACLHDRRRHLLAAVDLLREGSLQTLAGADRVVGALPSIEGCADPDYVAGERFVTMTDEAALSRAKAIAQARARFINGETTLAHEQIQTVRQEASAAEDVVALARSQLLRGRILADLLRFDEARTELVEAYEGARRNGLPVVASDAALTLSKVTSLELGHFDEGTLWLTLVDVEWPSAGDVRRTMLRALARAQIERASGDQPAALVAADRVAALLPRIQGRPLLVARVKRSLAYMYLSMGRLETGVPLAERALAEVQSIVGIGHPSTVASLATLALARRHQGDMEGAVKAARDTLTAAERGVGPDLLPLVPALESLANAQSQAGAVDDALSTYDRAAQLLADANGSPITRARLSWERGLLLAERDPSGAAAAHRRAYDWAREAIGEESSETLQYRVALAIALRRAGAEDEARSLLDGALKLGERVLGTQHQHVAEIRTELADDAMRRGAHDDAAQHYIRALDIWGDDAADSYAVAPLHIGACAAQTAAGRPQSALPHCEAAQELVAQSKGVADGTAERMHAAFADTLAALGRADEAQGHRRLAQPSNAPR